MVCDKVVCDKWCVKYGVSKMVFERWCVKKWCVKEGVSKMVPRLPHKTMVDVSLCHACHAKCRGVTGA